MPEWLDNLIISIGGGTVVLVGVLTVFKKLFIKLFESGIESSFEKNIEKYRNQLSRAGKAYEILLDREMRFYEHMEPIYAELVPLEHDLLYYLRNDKKHEIDAEDREKNCNAFREHFNRYTNLIITLKNEMLLHQSYIPHSVFVASSAVTKQMQDDMEFWFESAKLLFENKYDEINYEKGEKTVNNMLMHIAFVQMEIKNRLEELSTVK